MAATSAARESKSGVTRVAVSAIGLDRPGIVSGVTGVLVGLGCNLEDTSMSILRGHFAMMLVVAAAAGVTAEDLQEALGPVASTLDLTVVVRAIDDEVAPAAPGEPWTVSVHGSDRPGIVHRVSAELADRGVNIVDLTTRVVGAEGHHVYAMFLDVIIPPGILVADVEASLRALADELGVSCSMHPDDADIL